MGSHPEQPVPLTRRQLREAAAAASRPATTARPTPAPLIPTPTAAERAPRTSAPAWAQQQAPEPRARRATATLTAPAPAPAAPVRAAGPGPAGWTPSPPQRPVATPAVHTQIEHPAPVQRELAAPVEEGQRAASRRERSTPVPERRDDVQPSQPRPQAAVPLADVTALPVDVATALPAETRPGPGPAHEPAGRASRRASRGAERSRAARAEPHDAPAEPRASTSADAADVLPDPVPLRRAPRTLGRLGVLAALVGVTVVVPVTQGMAEGDFEVLPSTAPDYPSTVAALTALPLSDLPPTSLVSADGTTRLRELSDVSRAADRDPLPGCNGATRPSGSNGQLATADLCTLWDGRQQLRADAAVALAELNDAFVARFGTDICLTDGYRTLAEQYTLKAQKGGLAATPGKSNHGWGLAVDICGLQPGTSRWTWMNDNGPVYGWENPTWAKSGGSGPYEPWHWEYIKGVKADGSYYG
ncbi:D-alanyl-D-alanine carboxypeptidase family protein [Cellulomonas oligotrophica]|uniref:D-alanyl-D-alanine carboxypeptidase-like core domain-containing protein n=1 Tax=Cellulomonas oligotrophica TaxID=931536 RepID=A0A7Y9K0Y2_9CELL|nr:D-alanyl-D-alanine carboxypeptidase family protein [Cellulomonas oligotrophica]NYD87755.1 hypothetical protein [Cellulomonas oligotrophica]GIG33041.1 hypothetical protein Col01nite_22000 [Cellulomonas oligotrophica]